MKYNTAFPYFDPQDIDEILENFRGILEGKAMLSMGGHVSDFEKKFGEYLGLPHSIVTNSCSTALEVSLKALGIKVGDEVLVPVQTFFASASSIVNVGATPVFCNIDQDFMLDFEDLKNRITAKTKAVIIVHFGGLIHPQIEEIKIYLENENIALIEDCAHAHGAKHNEKFAGSFGETGCFSFYSTKIMTMGEGGAITSNNQEIYEKAKSLRSRGIDIHAPQEIFVNFGSNHRLTEIQALLGLKQLRRLEEFVSKRNAIAQRYTELLSPLVEEGLLRIQKNYFQESNSTSRHSYWRYTVFLENIRSEEAERMRQQIKEYMRAHDIAIDWAYMPLVHQQPAFLEMCGNIEGYNYSEKLSQTHFCLPIHVGIDEADAVYIANTLIDFFRKERK